MSAIPDPAYALTPSGNLRRRQLTSRLVVGAMVTAAGMAVAVLFILVYYAAKRGIGQMSLSFFTSDLPPYNGVGGGVGPALVGTAEMVLIATLVAVPVGVLTAIYLAEFANPLIARPLQTVIEILAGLPTVIAGIFISGLIVNRFGQSQLAGGLALSIVEVPLIARASLEALKRVPQPLREAADALGVAHWRTVLGVILPTASSGIVTATILAIARGAGETAPLLFTVNVFPQTFQLDPRHGVASAPIEIWELLESGYPAAVSKAWGLAFLLMFVILVTNIGARVWLRLSGS